MDSNRNLAWISGRKEDQSLLSGWEGIRRFERCILSHHSRFTCECNKEDINDDDDDWEGRPRRGGWSKT